MSRYSLVKVELKNKPLLILKFQDACLGARFLRFFHFSSDYSESVASRLARKLD